MSPEDQAITVCLDARDAQFKALRLVKACGFFREDIYQALCASEDRLTAAITIQLELRRQAASQKAA